MTGQSCPERFVMPRKSWQRKACWPPERREKSSCCRRRRMEWVVRSRPPRKKAPEIGCWEEQRREAVTPLRAAGICFAGYPPAWMWADARTGWRNRGGTQPADRTARWRALSRRKARGSPTHRRARGTRPQDGQARCKGRTPAGKDNACGPMRPPGKTRARRNRRHSGRRRRRGREENSKGGRPGAGQHRKSLYCRR